MIHSTSLPKASGSAATARRSLECVRDEVSERTLENARLLVSELVANAIEHVREEGEIELRISFAGGRLRVEVLDPGPGFTPRQRSPDSDRGWGLQYVDRLAASWGVDREDERSRVWFELLSET